MVLLYLITFLVVINLITFITYGNDKQRASKNKWRTPEKTLLLLAIIGGSVGALLGMQLFRHKTRKPIFKIGVPCMLLLHIGLLGKLLVSGILL